MNSPDSFAPWLAPLGWLALEISVVVLAAIVLQPLLRTAAARRSLWRAALLALVAVLAAELTGTGSQLPAQLRLTWQNTFPAPVPPLSPPIAIPPTEPSDSIPITYHPVPILSAELTAPLPGPASAHPSAPAHLLTFPPAPSPLPAFLWLAGLAALLARSVCTHAGFAWLRLRHFLPAADTLRDRVQALAARLGLRRRVRVLTSERLRAPAAFGWVQPGVGVPGDFTARFAPAQQDVMLAHELAHLAARDPLWQLLADFTAAALWWHPLVWVARRQHRLAGELAADDASQALPDGPVVLAECLLALGQEAAAAPRAALGMAGFRSQLGRRVERLVALPHRDWQAPSRVRLALQTTVALLALAALALLPGCAANRSASEAPSSLVAKWWQAKKTPLPVGDDVRSLQSKAERRTQNAEPSQRLVTASPTNDQPVLIQGRVIFNGTPPAEREIPVPHPLLGAVTTRLQEGDQWRKQKLAALEQARTEYKRLVESASDPTIGLQERDQRKQAAEAKLRDLQKIESNISETALAGRFLLEEQSRLRAKAFLTTRNYLRSPDGGLADVLVYVKHGLEGQTFTAPTNAHVIRIQGYEYQPYITAVQTGQPIRWETDVNLNFHPTPTNAANREFNRVLAPNRPVEATFPAPEFFLRTKDDVHPWLFGYVSVLPHPFFAVTDAEGRFRFPRPLPPGKYTLAAVHRRAGEAEQTLDLTQPLPAGQPVPSIEFQLTAQSGAATPPPLSAPVTFTTPPPRAADFTPSKPPTREELLERKARVEVEIKEAEKLYQPSHPKLIGLRKQLESVEEALKQAHGVKTQVEVVKMRLAQLESIEKKLQNPNLTPSERLTLLESATSWVPSSIPAPSSPPTVAERLLETDRRMRLLKDSLLKQMASWSNVVAATTRPQPQFNLVPIPVASVTKASDISVGRQLFVDDFLIASNSLQRTWHQPVLFSTAPLLARHDQIPPRHPFFEAAWYDPTNQQFMLGLVNGTRFFTDYHSPSGTNWVLMHARSHQGPLMEQPHRRVTTDYESLRVSLSRDAGIDGIQFGFARAGAEPMPRTGQPVIPQPIPADGSLWTDMHPLRNGFLIVGRNLYCYFGGKVTNYGPRITVPGFHQEQVAVGLATLRRDGFASLDAGPEGGVMTTKPVTFTGRYLFVNMKTNAPNGELRVEILHPDGRPITVTKNDTKQESQPFALASANPLAADQTLMGVNWLPGTSDLSTLVGRPVRFRFHLKNASLYSFWTSDSRFGRSHGRVAGGGPHFTNDVDTIGNRSYRPFPEVRTNSPVAPKAKDAAPANQPKAEASPSPFAERGTKVADSSAAANPSPLAPQRARESESAPPTPVAADVRRLTSPQTQAVGQSLVTSAPTAGKPVAASSAGAGRILRKLDAIVLPEVHFDGVPLEEVVKRLDADAKKFDPEKKGLNFLINSVAAQLPLLDANGNPVPGVQPVPLSEGLIRVGRPLKNLTLRQALDVICKTAELPTQFSVEEYAIVFIPRGPVAYYSRTFRVNPGAFIQSLQGVVGSPVPGVAGQASSPAPVRATVPATVPATQRTPAEINALVRQFFQSVGVTALGATNGSTSVLFNPENGLLTVRGTTNDLRVIDQALQKVQQHPGAVKK